MRLDLSHFTVRLLEASDILATGCPHLSKHLRQYVLEIQTALRLIYQLPNLGSVAMSDINIVSLVQQVEGVISAQQNEIAKLKAQISSAAADTIASDERAALANLGSVASAAQSALDPIAAQTVSPPAPPVAPTDGSTSSSGAATAVTQPSSPVEPTPVEPTTTA